MTKDITAKRMSVAFKAAIIFFAVLVGVVFWLRYANRSQLMQYSEIAPNGERVGKEIARDTIAEVYWDELARLDYKTGVIPKELQVHHKAIVAIPGFAVPLEDDISKVEEFLLVPNRMACIHAPPPPPNQMVYIKMNEAISLKDFWGPIWVTGTLLITDAASKYGKAMFEMKGIEIRPYEE